jgi:hypothetical protein
MRQFFLDVRVYRKQDQHYWTLYLRTQGTDIDDAAAQLRALTMGLLVAGALEVHCLAIYMDVPQGGATTGYKSLNQSEMIEDLKIFLGLKRDRRKKEDPAIDSETPISEEPA